VVVALEEALARNMFLTHLICPPPWQSQFRQRVVRAVLEPEQQMQAQVPMVAILCSELLFWPVEVVVVKVPSLGQAAEQAGLEAEAVEPLGPEPSGTEQQMSLEGFPLELPHQPEQADKAGRVVPLRADLPSMAVVVVAEPGMEFRQFLPTAEAQCMGELVEEVVAELQRVEFLSRVRPAGFATLM
jgi:hypothetical protein